MYSIGERVWYKSSRDRERGGTIAKVTKSTKSDTLYKIDIDLGQAPVYTTQENIRRMGPEKVPDTASDPDVIRIEKPSDKGGTKHDDGKLRLELIPVSGIEGIGRAMTFGAKKYAAHNWAQGFDYSRLVGAAMRHLTAWNAGEDKDPESGLSHLDHLGACVVMLIAHENEGLGNDDRRKVCKKS